MRLVFICFLILLFLGCSSEQDLRNRLLNPVSAGATGSWTGIPWTIYDDELKTGGGMMFYASPDGQVVDFECRTNPYQGTKCIKYSWNGSSVYDYCSATWTYKWAGIGLIAGKDWSEVTTVKRNLNPYTKVEFYARGSLSANTKIKIEGPKIAGCSDTTPAGSRTIETIELTPNWKYYSFPISGDMSQTNIFLGIIFEYDGTGPGSGGTVYIDKITFTR